MKVNTPPMGHSEAHRARLEALLTRALEQVPDTQEGRAEGYRRFSEALTPAMEAARSKGMDGRAEELEALAASLIVGHEEKARRAEIDAIGQDSNGQNQPYFDPLPDPASTAPEVVPDPVSDIMPGFSADERPDNQDLVSPETDDDPRSDIEATAAVARQARNPSGFALGLVTGVVASLLLAGTAATFVRDRWFGVAPVISDEDRQAAGPAVEAAVEVLQDIVDDIERTGVDETARLLGGPGFRKLPDGFGKTLDSQPPPIRRLLPVRLRVENGGYKVMIVSDICPLVVAEDPSLLDPRRARFGTLCSAFSLWNEAGRDF